MEKALVLSSGGVDSTTCVAMAVERFGEKNVSTVSVFYGQKHSKELQCARAVAEYYHLNHYELDLSPVMEYSDCSLLEHSTKDIIHESYGEQLEKKGGKPYDFIILDPPAFTKSRKTVKSAERGYKDINLRALRLLPRGGYFATASCSHFMPSELFEKMLRSAALDAGVELRQIEARQQSPDHPILWNVPETDYLKFYLFQVV